MKRTSWILGAIAAGTSLLAVWLFWPCVHNGLTHWDDTSYLELANAHRVSLAGVKWAFTNIFIYYHPLTWLSHGLDCQLWGLQPAGHHATSVVLHALNAGLVVVFAWVLLQSVASLNPVERLFLAGWVGLVFAVHPLQVEPTAWVAGRKTLLSAFFSLLCLIAYLHWARSEQRRRRWWLMVAAYACALLSKPMAVPLVAVLIILDFYPLGRLAKGGWGRVIAEKWLLLALTVVFAGLTVWGTSKTPAFNVIEETIPQRLVITGRSLVFYIWKTAWPSWLSPFYPLGEGIDWRRPECFTPFLACGLFTGLALWRRRRWPALLAGWGAYVALVLPVSGLVNGGGQAAADRFAYLPMVAILLLLGYGLIRLSRQLHPMLKLLLLVVLASDAVWLMARTRAQIPVWKDDVTLWQAVVWHYPQSQEEYLLIAQGLVVQERYDEAIPYAEHAYAVLTNPNSRQQLGLVYRDLAVGLVVHRRSAEAIPLAKRAVELAPQEPTARAALGLAELKAGNPSAAIPELELAVQGQPALAATRYNLACAYTQSGRLADAFAALQWAVHDSPGLLSMAVRDPELAALRASPDYAVRFESLTQPQPKPK